MERRAHAGRCKELPMELQLEGVGWFCSSLLPAAGADLLKVATGSGYDRREWVDLMIEAKDKEQAVFQLYRTYDLEPVIWENLRPEKAEVIKPNGWPETLRKTRSTKGKGIFSLCDARRSPKSWVS